MRFLFLILSCCVLQSAYAGGMSAWEKPTPGGNLMEYDGTSAYRAYVIWQKCPHVQADSLYFMEWYFYRGYIVGRRDSSAYLVVNETACTAVTFHSVEAFKQYVAEHHLRPFLWTRRYDPINNWEQLDTLLFAAVIFSPIVVPLLIFYAFILVGLFMGKKRTLIKIIFLVALPLIVLLAALLQGLPQSF